MQERKTQIKNIEQVMHVLRITKNILRHADNPFQQELNLDAQLPEVDITAHNETITITIRR